MQWAIGVRVIVERDIVERNIRGTVATCRLAEQMLIHIYFGGGSSNLSFWQTWHRQLGWLRRQKPQIRQPTDEMCHHHLWCWVGVRGMWQLGRHRILLLRGMLAGLLALFL
jgi:hypothetical protein